MEPDEFCSARPFIRADVWVHLEDGRTCSAVLSNRDGHLVLEVHDVAVVHGICADPAWRSRSVDLAGRGQTVDVWHDGMHLLSIGVIEPTREAIVSSHIAYGAWPGAKAVLAVPSIPSAAT